jgi:hypothetical protein
MRSIPTNLRSFWCDGRLLRTTERKYDLVVYALLVSRRLEHQPYSTIGETAPLKQIFIFYHLLVGAGFLIAFFSGGQFLKTLQSVHYRCWSQELHFWLRFRSARWRFVTASYSRDRLPPSCSWCAGLPSEVSPRWRTFCLRPPSILVRPKDCMSARSVVISSKSVTSGLLFKRIIFYLCDSAFPHAGVKS